MASTMFKTVGMNTVANVAVKKSGRSMLTVRATSSGTSSGKATPEEEKKWSLLPFKPGTFKSIYASGDLYPEGLPNFPGSSPYNTDWEETLWPEWKKNIMRGKTEEEIQWVADSELFHGRWAMLGCAGAWGAEVGTGVPWFKAGALCTPADCTAVNTIFPGQVAALAPEGSGFPSFYNVVLIEVLAIGLAESYRWGKGGFTGLRESWGIEEGSMHPGTEHFDPLGLSETFDLDEMKVAEIKHARLAMLSWLGYMSQAVATNCDNPFGLGPNDTWPSYIDGAVGPYGNWQAHIANPVSENVWKYIGLESTAGQI